MFHTENIALFFLAMCSVPLLLSLSGLGLRDTPAPMLGVTSSLAPEPGVGLSSRDCSTLVLKLLLCSDLFLNFFLAKFPPT